MWWGHSISMYRAKAFGLKHNGYRSIQAYELWLNEHKSTRVWTCSVGYCCSAQSWIVFKTRRSCVTRQIPRQIPHHEVYNGIVPGLFNYTQLWLVLWLWRKFCAKLNSLIHQNDKRQEWRRYIKLRNAGSVLTTLTLYA